MEAAAGLLFLAKSLMQAESGDGRVAKQRMAKSGVSVWAGGSYNEESTAPLAQPEERFHGKEKVVSSSLTGSSPKPLVKSPTGSGAA